MMEVNLEKLYGELKEKNDATRKAFNRPLTLAEKILFSHVRKLPKTFLPRGKDTLEFTPDRVAMQDATAQMAILQFMTTQLDTVKVPSTIHCDHLIKAYKGAKSDLLASIDENHEVFEFLRTAGERYGIGFWKPNSGIIHQIVLEQYAFPGGMIIGTDSHTPNAGGLGMLAIGVGGADAVDVMSGLPWGLLNPKITGIKLTGKLSDWASPKDIILAVAGRLTVAGGTGKIIEYFGPGCSTISCTGKATICNMGAEIGATTSVFPYDDSMAAFLVSSNRKHIADFANEHRSELVADPEVVQDPSRYYDEIFEINLSELKPSWVGPHTPDLLRKASEMKAVCEKEEIPRKVTFALIGSCTNSSYEDMGRAASVARVAISKGLKVKTPLMVTPGSDQVFKTAERDGFIADLKAIGAEVLANACGPCIGQWKRDDIKKGEKNTIITSYNRNFAKRNDGNPDTLAFIGSPELVTAVALSGDLGFNPETDELDSESGKFKLPNPYGDALPASGYVLSREGFVDPSDNVEIRKKVEVKIDPNSERLAFLERFPAWSGDDWENLTLLLKAKGKCTTDHISQAGVWLKYRGHLPNISQNCYLGAVNSFTDVAGIGKNSVNGEEMPFPAIGNFYRLNKIPWIVVADHNYGEGSSREHAAMEPRYLGCLAVVVKSFARIAETNLKKQGILPLTFVNEQDYDLVKEDSKFDILGLKELAPGSKIQMVIKTGTDSKVVALKHSLTEEQVTWFKAGSALNAVN